MADNGYDILWTSEWQTKIKEPTKKEENQTSKDDFKKKEKKFNTQRNEKFNFVKGAEYERANSIKKYMQWINFIGCKDTLIQ